jgi:hypothetical protein
LTLATCRQVNYEQRLHTQPGTAVVVIVVESQVNALQRLTRLSLGGCYASQLLTCTNY